MSEIKNLPLVQIPNTPDDIGSLVSELAGAEQEFRRLAFDDNEPPQLGPPASPAALASLAQRLGRPLPPSYRQFLERHDGWARFDGDGSLLSTADQTSAWVKEAILSKLDLFDAKAGENPFKVGCLPVMLGPTIRNYTVLDPRTVRADGEMDIVTFDLVLEEDRFKNFAEYLRHCLAITRRMIEDEKLGARDVDEKA